VQRTVRLRGVPHEFRGVSVDLIEIRAVRCEPAVARPAGDGRIQTSRRAVARNSCTRRILRDLEALAVEAKRADVAVAEIRRIHGSISRRDGEPAQLGRQPGAGVDLHQRTHLEFPVSIDGSYGTPVADRISDDEGIRLAVQEGDVERRSPLRVLERALSKLAV